MVSLPVMPESNNTIPTTTSETFTQSKSPPTNTLLDTDTPKELPNSEHIISNTNPTSNYLSCENDMQCDLPQSNVYLPNGRRSYQSHSRTWAGKRNSMVNSTGHINYGMVYKNNINYQLQPVYYTGYGDNHANPMPSWMINGDSPRFVSKLCYGEQPNFHPNQCEVVSKGDLFHNNHTQAYFPDEIVPHQTTPYHHLTYQPNFPPITNRLPPQIVDQTMTQQLPTDTMSVPSMVPQATTQPYHSQTLPQGDTHAMSTYLEFPSYYPPSSTPWCDFQFKQPPSEGVLTTDQSFLPPCLYDRNETQLHKSLNPSNHLSRIADTESTFENFSESNGYTHITLGRGLNSRELRYVPNESATSCRYVRRGELLGNHFMEKPGIPSEVNGKCSVNDVDVVGLDMNEPDPILDAKEVPRKTATTKTVSRATECKVCGKILARKSTLKIHMRQHTGDRPFKCATCGKTFTQAGLLYSHRRTHTGERPFTCSHCRKRFSHSGALKTHMRTHTGERPHKCRMPGCNLAFGDSSTLAKHRRTHTGERPYACDICNKRFTQSGNMHKHKKGVHHVEYSSTKKGTEMKERIPESIAALLLASKSDH